MHCDTGQHHGAASHPMCVFDARLHSSSGIELLFGRVVCSFPRHFSVPYCDAGGLCDDDLRCQH